MVFLLVQESHQMGKQGLHHQILLMLHHMVFLLQIVYQCLCRPFPLKGSLLPLLYHQQLMTLHPKVFMVLHMQLSQQMCHSKHLKALLSRIQCMNHLQLTKSCSRLQVHLRPRHRVECIPNRPQIALENLLSVFLLFLHQQDQF